MDTVAQVSYVVTGSLVSIKYPGSVMATVAQVSDVVTGSLVNNNPILFHFRKLVV